MSNKYIVNWNQQPKEVVTFPKLTLFKTRCDILCQEVQYDTQVLFSIYHCVDLCIRTLASFFKLIMDSFRALQEFFNCQLFRLFLCVFSIRNVAKIMSNLHYGAHNIKGDVVCKRIAQNKIN